MYGLEDNPKNFLFELEKKIKEKPEMKKQLLEKAETQIAELKKSLRDGKQDEHFDQLGVLLNGYLALQKTLTRIET